MPVTPPDVSVVVPVFDNGSTLDELIDRQLQVLDERDVPPAPTRGAPR